MLALKNVCILYNPLRVEDATVYNAVRNRQISIGAELRIKRLATQTRYRDTRRQRLSVFRVNDLSNSTSDTVDENEDACVLNLVEHE